MLKVLKLVLWMFVSTNVFAGYADGIADRVEVVGILGNEHAGTDFDGIVVLKMDSGKLAFLRLHERLPGYSGIQIVKVEKKRVYIGTRGESVPLMWLTSGEGSGDSGERYAASSENFDSPEVPAYDSDPPPPVVRDSSPENGLVPQYDNRGYADDMMPPPPPPPPPPVLMNDGNDFGYSEDYDLAE
jgi:hypothetical protein